jgi:hypothetical protein
MPENLVLADGSNMPSADIALVPALIDVLRKI